MAEIGGGEMKGELGGRAGNDDEFKFRGVRSRLSEPEDSSLQLNLID